MADACCTSGVQKDGTKLERQIQTFLTVVCGVFALLSFFVWEPWTAYVAIAAGGYFAVRTALDSLIAREIDVNVLMILAAVGAIFVGHPEDAAALLFLFALSGTLESFAMARTESAIDGLIKLRPDRAIRLMEGGQEIVPVEVLVAGDHIRIASFENIPTDGVLISGESSVNRAAMTGESEPEVVTAGSEVLGGTQNLEGMFVMEVTVPTSQSALEKIVTLVKDAQMNKASGERISQWFGERYTFFVIGAFLLSFAIRMLIKQPFNEAIYGAIVLLVALSPCALVISTPATTLSALAWAARNGILVRGGEFLERIGRVTTAALDKTGTLTLGKPRLIEVCVCVPVTVGAKVCLEEQSCWHGGTEISDEAAVMLRAAATAEQYSSHPIAEAVVKAARALRLDVPEALEMRDEPGKGVYARTQEGEIWVGQLRFFEDLPEEFIVHVKDLQMRGMTVAVLKFKGKFAALGLRDEPRPEAGAFLNDLRKTGLDDIWVLTGDTEATAQAVAKELGLTNIRAGLLPDEKEQVIAELSDQGKQVLMVGDGINDAPSLSRASVGIAMGGLGSDIALNAADIVLMQDKLSRIPELIRVGRRTNSVIRANLIFAASVICALTVSSFFFQLPLPVAVFGHEGSTVLVILNGLRMLRGPR